MNKQKTTEIVLDLINRYVEYERPEWRDYHCTVYEKIENLPFDSLDHVELVMDFEEIFGIDIRDEDSEKWVIIGDIINYILRAAGEENEECRPTRFEVITQDIQSLAQAIYDKYPVGSIESIENWLREEI